MKNFSLIVIAAFSFCIISCGHDIKKPGYEIKMLTDMMHPVPYEAFSQNPVFKDGQTMQSPVEGTVYRGALVANPFLRNAQPLTKEDMSRGKFVYENYCLVCHGPTGEADGPLIPKYPNPPDYKTQRLMMMMPEEMFLSVSFGKKNMPAHAGQIEELDRWRVIYYVMSLQGRVK